MAETQKKSRWLPIALGVSLALNLAVVAAVGGAVWRHGGDRPDGPPRTGKSGGALYMQALPREARRAIRAQIRATPRSEQRGAQDMLAALRQEPFDPAAAARVLAAERDGGAARRELATAAWLEQVSAMSTGERAAYADRLEQMAEQGKARWKERIKDRD